MAYREELGVITSVDCGMRDCGSPVVWFSVDLLVGVVLIILPWEGSTDLIKKSNVYSLKNLVGKAVVLSTADNGTSYEFVRIK